MPFDFHSKSDNIGESITLFQINNGDCIGGFSNDNWSSPESWKEKSDKPLNNLSSLLFNLSAHTSFPCKPDTKEAI
jgi:hypothetical protein